MMAFESDEMIFKFMRRFSSSAIYIFSKEQSIRNLKAMSRGEIYGSLPPQVPGPSMGEISLRISKIIFKDRRQVKLTGFRVEFNWWGDVNDRPIALAIPWKPGQVIDEAVFPLVVGPAALEGYFSDMGDELELRLFDDNVLYGTAIVPLHGLINHRLSYSGKIPVKVLNPSNAAHLCIELKTNYDNENESGKGGMAKTLVKKNNDGSLISAFERMEVLIIYMLYHRSIFFDANICCACL